MTGTTSTRRGLDPAWYLAAVLLGFLLVQSSLFVSAAVGAAPGPVLELILVLAGPLVGAALWWRADGDANPLNVPVRAFLLLLLAVWLIALAGTVMRGGEANALVFVVPILIAFVWTKPPTRRSVIAAGDAYVIGVAGVSVVALVLEVVGLVPSWYEALLANPAELEAYERIAYWVPLAEPLGLDGRWAGPFLHPNFAGMAMALVVLWGTGRFGVEVMSSRWRASAGWGALVLIALGMMLLTSSRTAIGAALAGTLVLIAAVAVWVRTRSIVAYALPTVSTVLLGLMLLGSWAYAGGIADASATIAANANLSGRTEVWAEYWQMWKSSLWFGVGDSGIASAIDAGTLPDWATHAHNLVLDAGARYGIVFLLLVLALLLASLLSASRAARQGTVWGLAIVVMLVAEGLTETPFKWLYLTPTLAGLVLAALLGCSPPTTLSTAASADG
ncbi:MAG: hypothetical protein GC156_00730 [Actinomycetales bacterium]|nr:hypothetical protein [Actinomycetales bacterium]